MAGSPHAQNRGLRPARRSADRRPGRPHRLDRLALPAALRLPRLLRRLVGHAGRRALADRPGVRWHLHPPPVPPRHAGTADGVGHSGRDGPSHRLHATPRAGLGDGLGVHGASRGQRAVRADLAPEPRARAGDRRPPEGSARDDRLLGGLDPQRHAITGPYRAAITRSLVTLKALAYEPTGGIVAAVTTSLPEQIGGPRNWDYRYSWLRDSTYTLQALISAGYLAEARAWREWLLRAIAGNPAKLQIMYALDGTRRLPEAELPWLAGYEGSRPVRTGNAASEQLQLDVWGETLDGLALARDAGIGTHDDAWDVQTALMNHLEAAWDQPDNGLWEMRGARRHFTHSKVMAWVAADRMVRAVRAHPDLHGPADRWETLRDTIHADVLARGYDSRRNTFTQSYGASALDASLLMIPRVGFLPATDPRVRGTIEAIERELTEDGFVRRYEATELFERLLTLRNDVGLLSEEWDPVAGRQLGNTPQAFSHFPLVTSGLQLHAGRAHRSNERIRHSGPGRA